MPAGMRAALDAEAQGPGLAAVLGVIGIKMVIADWWHVSTGLSLALVGGILMMFAFKINLSVSTAIGFIVLFGTAVQNGVVLMTFFSQLREKGLCTMDAIRKGCELRLRPLMMTSLSAILGILPMIYATGSGSELQRPLAVVILGGMASSLAVTLLVLPAIYHIAESRRDRAEAKA